MEVSSLDPCGIALAPRAAFLQGLHVMLEVVEISDVVVAKPMFDDVGLSIVHCKIPSWVKDFMEKGMTFTITNFLADGDDENMILVGKDGCLLPIMHPRKHDVNIAEAFSGLGGWTHGALWNGAQPVMLVEADRSVAEVCARNHGMQVFTITEALDAISLQCIPKGFVLHADVNDYRVFVIAGLLRVGTWLASPPCQPWSRASWQRGLEDTEGAVFGTFIFWTGASRARCVNLENVPGLPDHPHYEALRRVMSLSGFDLVCASRDRVMPVLPIMRVRWLATCIRKDVVLTETKLSMARSVCLPHQMPGIGEVNSVGIFGCIQAELQEWEVKQCVPDASVLAILGNPDFLPLNMREKNFKKLTCSEVLKMRIRDIQQPFPNVMAAQGSQHMLPHDLLEEKGLYSFLMNVNECLRFATPFEILAAMGFPATTGLPDVFQEAWHLVGNALSVPHAALQCFRTWVLLGEISGFSGELKSINDLCHAVSLRKCNLGKFQVVRKDGFMKLVQKEIVPETVKITAIDSSDEIEEVASPIPCKRICVSPTWHCMEDEPSLIPELNRAECPDLVSMTVGSKTVPFGMPFLYEIKPEFQEQKGDHIIVKLLHSQGFWMAGFAIPKMWSIKSIFQSVMQHARQEHFDHIEVNGVKAWFGSTPIGEGILNIRFKPFCFARTVVTPFMKLGLAVEVDATWKFKDLCAYIATEAAVLPSCLQIVTRDRIMRPEDFVLSTTEMHFQAVPIVHELGTPKEIEVPVPVAVNEAVFSDEGSPFHPGVLRFTLRNPKWGTVKSCAVSENVSVEELLGCLLPDFMQGPAPQFCHEGKLIDPKMLVKELPKSDLSIYFPTAKPWPVVEVIVTRFSIRSAFADEDGHSIHMWIKGPFDFRAKQLKLSSDQTLSHVAAKLLSEVKSDLTLLVMQNGKGIDPRLALHQIQQDHTIEFRACALPGGAKGNPKTLEANAKKLKPILAQRGVPEEALAARAALIAGAIDTTELATILTKDEKQIWDELKIKANQARIRMITHMELKDHQKMQRKKASEGTLKNEQAKAKVPKQPASSNAEPLKKVFIDPKHFTCPTGKIGIIDLTQWGPDQCGIAIATTAEASKMMPVNKISPDALALVVLTRETFAGQSPIALPATEISGKPVLTSAVVLNFGDIEVQCKPNLPKVDLLETPTATLEVFIMKELVNQWQDVQNPLNYLGLQLPEIRKGQVIASWNFRTYDDKRQRCKHEHGTYVHGFVKIPDDLLQATLVRSGQAGVFLQVKAENKKPDPRFGVVAMHGQSLEEVVKMAKGLKNVLGVVQLGQNGVFALRARREHIQEIRRNALPQGISMQEGEIPAGANWWTLRNLNASTTCEAITAALRELGWDATAIKPAGKSAWLVCSTEEPPASHLCIGQDYVAVTPVRSQTGMRTNEFPSTTVKVGANFISMCPEEPSQDVTTPTTVASRVDDIKADLEEKLSNMIHDRMKECDLRVSTLAATVEHVQAEVQEVQTAVDDLRAETMGEFTSIKGDIATGNATIMNQMQNLFQKMQTELQTTLIANKDSAETEPKRPRH